jgi:hypothetical protein
MKVVRPSAARCGYVRLCADFWKQGPAVATMLLPSSKALPPSRCAMADEMAGKEALTAMGRNYFYDRFADWRLLPPDYHFHIGA